MSTLPQVQTCHQTVTTAWIAFGSNLTGSVGNPLEIVGYAIAALQQFGADFEVSPLYCSAAFPSGSGPDFVNGVARFSWGETPQKLLNLLHKVEADFGRERRGRWTPRTLDLDLLALGSHVCPDAESEAYWRQLDPSQAQVKTPKTVKLSPESCLFFSISIISYFRLDSSSLLILI